MRMPVPQPRAGSRGGLQEEPRAHSAPLQCLQESGPRTDQWGSRQGHQAQSPAVRPVTQVLPSPPALGSAAPAHLPTPSEGDHGLPGYSRTTLGAAAAMTKGQGLNLGLSLAALLIFQASPLPSAPSRRPKERSLAG